MTLFFTLILALVCPWALASQPVTFTPNEALYLPVLKQEIQSYWPDMPLRSSLAAQVQQETCPSLKSKSCFSPRAELKTPLEYGFGLGQLTVTPKYNNFEAAKKLDKSLNTWAWDHRYDARFQLRTLVLTNRKNYYSFGWAATPTDRLAFMFSAYNGGVGGVLSDRAVCRATPNCDPGRWFGNVALTSKKAKVAVKGYGQSFYQINRGYVENVLGTRRSRYINYFEE